MLNARSSYVLNAALVGTGQVIHPICFIINFQYSDVFNEHNLMDPGQILDMEQELAFIPTGNFPPHSFFIIYSSLLQKKISVMMMHPIYSFVSVPTPRIIASFHFRRSILHWM